MTLSTRYLLRLMAVEEWRLHSRTFGGRRFALFPFFVAAVAGGTAAFFALADATKKGNSANRRPPKVRLWSRHSSTAISRTR